MGETMTEIDHVSFYTEKDGTFQIAIPKLDGKSAIITLQHNVNGHNQPKFHRLIQGVIRFSLFVFIRNNKIHVYYCFKKKILFLLGKKNNFRRFCLSI